MTPFISDEACKALHITYVEATGNAVSLTLRKLDAWRLFAGQGWTADDIRLVVRYIRKRFHRPDQPHIAKCMLHWNKLVEDVECFEAYLCDARADQRNARPPRTTRDVALQATGRPAELQAMGAPAKSVGELMAESKEWKALKRDLGL